MLPSGGRGALAGLSVFGAALLLTAAMASAQNLDQGKSPAKLFADGCATCHRSPRGLAKGRFSFTLYLFLKQHYSSGSESAWALASYLESVDTGSGGAKRAARPAHSASSSRSSLRPPAPIPGR